MNLIWYIRVPFEEDRVITTKNKRLPTYQYMYVYETIVYTKMRMNVSKTQAHNVERSPLVQQCRDTHSQRGS